MTTCNDNRHEGEKPAIENGIMSHYKRLTPRYGPDRDKITKVKTQVRRFVMKKILLCAVVVIGLAAIQSKSRIAGADELEKGKEIYTNKCQMCHRANGKGDGPAAKLFNPRPYDLTTAEFWKDDAEEKIKDAVENGFGAMPAIGLSSSQIRAVIDYMAHAFKK